MSYYDDGYGGRHGDFGPTGTKVRNVQTDKSQYRTYVIQAIVGSIGGDVVILLVALFMLAVGWPVLLAVLAGAVFLLSKKGARVAIWFMNLFMREKLTAADTVRLRKPLAYAVIIAVAFYTTGWWKWLVIRDQFLLLILETITPLFGPFTLPPLIAYISLIGLWFVGVLKKWGTATFVAIIGCLTAWTISQVNYTVDFELIWSRARYLGALLLVPPSCFGLVLVFAMIKEMIAPNLNFILDPMTWAEYSQAGLLGLIFPKYIQWKDRMLDRRVRVAVEDGNGNDTRMDFLDTPKMHEFATAILNGAEFKEETAKQYLGYGRKRWEKFRDKFFDRGWATWRNEHHHQDGIDLLAAGRAALNGLLPH